MKAVYDRDSLVVFFSGFYSSKGLAPHEINSINLLAVPEDFYPAGIPYFPALHLVVT